jgi:hypothetical protein
VSSEGVESESESALVGNSTRKSRLDVLDAGDEPERTSGRLDSSLIVHVYDDSCRTTSITEEEGSVMPPRPMWKLPRRVEH